MLKVHSDIKALFAQPGVRKNFRVTFPNGERADIINDNIVQESVVLTESCCSETVFRFGCCERSMIEFETVGVENIRGCKIQCFLEIDTSSLTAAQLSLIQIDITYYGDVGKLVDAASSDTGFGYYRLPYGIYWVDSCPRDKSARTHRKVTAYSADPTKLSEVETVRLSTFVPGYETIKSKPLDLAAVSLCYLTPGLLADWGYSSTSAKGWTAIKNGAAGDTATFSVTENGHTYAVAISGTYYSWTNVSANSDTTFPYAIKMRGWDSDEAWAWFRGVFADAGVSEPTVAAHTRLPRTYLQPHLGYDVLDQYGPYDHAPIYWLPDAGCPFFLYSAHPLALNAQTFVRLMWNLTCTFSIDGVVQETRTFFPVADLNAEIRSITGGPSNTAMAYEATDKYTNNGTDQFIFLDSFNVLDFAAAPLELRAQQMAVSKTGIPELIRLNNTSPASVSADRVESVFWEDSAIESIGQVQWKAKRTYGGELVVNVSETGTGGKSIYKMLNNAELQNGSGYSPSIVVNNFISHLAAAEYIPFEGVIHDMPWLQPGDAVQLATGDPNEPTLSTIILTQTLKGIQALSQEIGANGGSVIYSDNAYYEGVAMIYGDASGSGGGSSSGGGGGGGGAGIPAGGTTGQVLAKASDDDYDAGWVDPGTDWTYLGSSSNSSTTVTYPSTAKEILAVGKITHNGGATEYSAVFKVSTISDRDRLQVGGYYYGSSDYGIASVNHDAANRTLALRNIRYVSTTTGTFYFYYR